MRLQFGGMGEETCAHYPVMHCKNLRYAWLLFIQFGYDQHGHQPKPAWSWHLCDDGRHGLV